MSIGIRRGYVDLPSAHGGGQIHYRQGGTGSPTLVLLHQTPSTSAMYEPLMQALGQDFDLLALDTPGFGQSDALPGAFSIAAAAAAIAAAVSAMRNGPCFWFGHHTGAALALQLAHDRPELVSRLALSGPCLLDERLKKRLPQLASPLPLAEDGSHLQKIWERMAAKDVSLPLELCQREVLSGAAAGRRYPEAYRAVTRVDTAAQLRALQCPTLVFAGTEDPLYRQLDAAHRLLRDGHKAEISGARSYVCERQTPAVAALLREFFGAAP